VPDLNLFISGAGEFWIELKAGTTHTDLRPAQYAWAMRRIALGGRVVVLNRHTAKESRFNAWFLHDLRRASFEPKGQHMRVTSEPHYTGFSIQLLDECLKSL